MARSITSHGSLKFVRPALSLSIRRSPALGETLSIKMAGNTKPRAAHFAFSLNLDGPPTCERQHLILSLNLDGPPTRERQHLILSLNLDR